ncbi:MAG: transposase [Treponema sp.]|jgi:putative transposase|nr:transposase [Treponema sp.]
MRPPRILQKGATYHVASRIDHGAFALGDDDVKRIFLAMVILAKKKFLFKLWNFSIMDNHIHFLIKPADGVSLSKIMQWLKCNFAKKWNKAHGTTGHLWGERFFSRIIEDAADFKQTSAYIDKNPVDAGLVKNAVSWKFCGLSYWINGMRELVDDLWEGLWSFGTIDAHSDNGIRHQELEKINRRVFLRSRRH